MTQKKSVSVFSMRWLRMCLYIGLIALLVFVIIQQWPALASSFDEIVAINPLYIAAGFGALLLSVISSTGVYRALSPRPLRFWRTALVQTAGLGVNRLLPAGSGALAVSYVYLRANKLSKALAAAVTAGNNLFGFIGHAILLVTACVIWPETLAQFTDLSFSNFSVWLGVAGLLLAAVGIAWWLSRRSQFFSVIKPLFDRPDRLGFALVCSMAITLCYTLAVILASAAMGVTLSPATALIVLSFGVAAASAVPVPGGIGAAEAGLYFGLHSYGLSNADALAIAILYRVMTFWLPLIVGLLAFVFATSRGLLGGTLHTRARPQRGKV